MANDSTQITSANGLEDTEHYYHEFLEGLHAPVYTCDTLGYLKFYNQAAVNFWGVEPQIGKTKWCGSFKIYCSDGSPMLLEECPMAVILRDGVVADYEEIIVERPDGIRINVLPHLKLIKNSEGNIVGAINMLQDITALRTSEQKLRNSALLQLEEAESFKINLRASESHGLQLENEAEKRTQELELANKEIVFQNVEKGKRAAEFAIANDELTFQNGEKEKRAFELIIARTELAYQNTEKAKRVTELAFANEELIFQMKEKEKRAAELVISGKELVFQNDERNRFAEELSIANKELVFQESERGKRVAELIVLNGELAFQIEEKEKRATELIESNRNLALQLEKVAQLVIINGELLFQNREKEKRASELIIANGELAFQNGEKVRRASELIIANDELAFQSAEKGKRAAELIIANGELAFQNGEKEKRASELIIANGELAFQNGEKEKRAAELVLANRELVFQNSEKEKRAAELIVANRELAYQNLEKGKRAAELIIANGELAFQIGEKEKRAAELIIANVELDFQNKEKGKRAAELIVANEELAFQNKEKEKRAAELINLNEGLEAFSYVSSHDLQEPLRKIQILSSRLLDIEKDTLSIKAKEYLVRMQSAASRMRSLINDLLEFSKLNITERKFEETDLTKIIEEVKYELKEVMDERNVTIEATNLCTLKIIPFQFRQIMHNLIGNALKFSKPGVSPHITITSSIGLGLKFNEPKLSPQVNYCHIAISDNGIGFDPEHKDRIFEVFQRLHGMAQYAGTGIGLAIVKRAVDNHNGFITATGALDKGATFNIYIPVS
ncbi:MAG: ATP-binding protein [Chryseolinea sp.]